MLAAEDPQGEPITAYFVSPLQGGIIVDDRSALNMTLPDGYTGTATITFSNQGFLIEYQQGQAFRPHVGRGLLLEVAGADDILLSAPQQSPGDEAYEGRQRIPWVHLASPPYISAATDLLQAAKEASPAIERAVQDTNGRGLIGIHLSEEVSQGVFETTWTFVTFMAHRSTRSKSGDPRRRQEPRLSAVNHVRALRRSEADLGQRIPSLFPLRSKSVTIVGLGSLGMPIAQELIKARVNRLTAIDPDIIDPGTSVRHPMGISMGGVYKSLALALWAADHDPDVTVQPIMLTVGLTPEELEHDASTELVVLQDALEGSDLIIGATAEHDVNRQLDDYGVDLDLPRLFVWSQSGYGGFVLLLTRETGCFHCFELLQRDRIVGGLPLVSVPETDASTVIQGRGCADKTFTASHPDLLPLSIEAARVAVELLATGQKDAYGLGGLALQNRDPVNGRPIPPKWTPFDVPPHPGCPRCTP